MSVDESDLSPHVLDASALLALLYDEPGQEIVERAMDVGVSMSVINWAEVLTRAAEMGDDPKRVANLFEVGRILNRQFVIEPVGFDDCLEIARLRLLTKKQGLGLGDRACLALAKRVNLPVMTADRIWASLEVGVTVNLIR